MSYAAAMTMKLTDLSLLAMPLEMTTPDLGDLFIDLHGAFQGWLADDSTRAAGRTARL